MKEINLSIRLGASFALILSLVACQTSNELAGTIIGGTAGAMVGDQVGSGSGNKAAIALGAIVGASAGRAIGASLDQNSRNQMGGSTFQSLNSGQRISWNNPNNYGGPASGNTQITNIGTTADGQECREYLNTVNIGGQQQTAYGTACRYPGGSWKIVQ
ncbi:MAG: glycine zipper 2TM domain-containing protein [Aestuariivita sp.]|nr:glycine zipper 2TM domain-containing protein [Aestuariivita sp.]